MKRLSSTDQSGSGHHVSGGQNQRARAGQASILSTSYGSVRGSFSITQRGGAQAGPSQEPHHQVITPNQSNDAHMALFGHQELSEVFGSSQSLGRPVFPFPDVNSQDQMSFQSSHQHIGAHSHDVSDWAHVAGNPLHPFSQPQHQEEDVTLPPPNAPRTGPSAIPRHVTGTLAAPSSSRQPRAPNLTEAQLHTLDESAKRIMKDYAGNNPEARQILFSYLQCIVDFFRGSGQARLVAQGGKQKEYAAILPVGDPGPKGGYDHWRCGLCRPDQAGKGRTFQKVVGHFLSEHYHKAHPKPDLWVCDQQSCTRGYSGLNELNRHRNSEHGLPMPKRAKEPASTPSPRPDYPTPPSPSVQKVNKGGRRVKPYPDASDRRQSHIDSAAQEAVYPNAQYPFSPASGSHAPTSTRVQRHSGHFAPGTLYSNQATSHAPQHQGYSAPMPDNMYQVPMGHAGQPRLSMPTPMHYSPADMNPPLSPSPSMPMPNVSNSFYSSNQFGQFYSQQ